MTPEMTKVLQNTAVIAVDQDPLGIQGNRVLRNQVRYGNSSCYSVILCLPFLGSDCFMHCTLDLCSLYCTPGDTSQCTALQEAPAWCPH